MASLVSRGLTVLLALFSSRSDDTQAHAVGRRSSSGYQNAVYYANWDIYGRDYQPQSLPASEITHLLYAFANLQSDGTVYSSDTYADLQKHYSTDSWNDVGNNAYGCVKQLYILKKYNRQFKVLLSIGGWTYSSNFSPAASTAAGRSTFASTAVTLMKDWGFDGIDIDWEYPASATDAENFVLLLQAVRSAMDAYAAEYAPGYHFLLTVASPAGPTNYDQLDLATMASVVDQFNLMAYDYDGSWASYSGHQANLYPDPADMNATPFNTDQAVTAYLAGGVSPSQLLLGMPIYGRSFDDTAGLGDTYSGVGAGSWQAGVWDYKVLPRAGATEYYDPVASASYSYDPVAEELITYDNVAMVQRKVAYLQHRGLGGSMFWEASGDRNDSGSLVLASYDALGGGVALDSSLNLLSYPDSQYANIVAGMPDN